MTRIRWGMTVAIALSLTTPALANPADGFAAFWSAFAAAATKDDTKALTSMVVIGPGLGDAGTSFAKLHREYLGRAARRCLVKAKPLRDVDGQGAVTYEAFCGQIIYVFSKPGDTWKLTDLGSND
jgi:hypothetical protein